MTETITGASLQESLIDFLRQQGFVVQQIDDSSPSLSFSEDQLQAPTNLKSLAQDFSPPPVQREISRKPDLGKSDVYRGEDGKLRDVMGAFIALFKIFAKANANMQAKDTQIKMELLKQTFKLQQQNADNNFKSALKSAIILEDMVALQWEIFAFEVVMAARAAAILVRTSAGDPSAPAEGAAVSAETAKVQAQKESAKTTLKIVIAGQIIAAIMAPGGPMDQLLKEIFPDNKKARKLTKIFLEIFAAVALIGPGTIAKAAAKQVSKTAAAMSAKQIAVSIASKVASAVASIAARSSGKTAAKKTATEIAKGVARAIVKAIATAANMLATAVVTLVSMAAKGASMVAKKVKSAVQKVVTALVRKVKSILKSIVQTVGDIAQNIASGTIGKYIMNAVKNALRSMARKISNIIDALTTMDTSMSAGQQIGASLLTQGLVEAALLIAEEADVKDGKAQLALTVGLSIGAAALAGGVVAGAAEQTAENTAKDIGSQVGEKIGLQLGRAAVTFSGSLMQMVQSLQSGLQKLEQGKNEEAIAVTEAIISILQAALSDQNSVAEEYKKMAEKVQSALVGSMQSRMQAFELARQSAA